MPKSKTDYDKWLPEAIKETRTDNPLRTPYDVALVEAAGLAAFVRDYWEKDEKSGRPGLARVKKRLPKSTADDIVSLIHAVQAAQTKLLLIVDPLVVELGDRAREVADTLEAALEFLLDDGVEEPADQQLAQIQEYHSQDGQRSSTLAQALGNFAALAETLKDRLVEADEEFDPALIDEANELSKKLAEAKATPDEKGKEATEASKIRNQMLHLLTKRMGLVRQAAAYVFAGYPDIARKATSAYQQRQRRANRKAKKAAGEAVDKGKKPEG